MLLQLVLLLIEKNVPFFLFFLSHFPNYLLLKHIFWGEPLRHFITRCNDDDASVCVIGKPPWGSLHSSDFKSFLCGRKHMTWPLQHTRVRSCIDWSPVLQQEKYPLENLTKLFNLRPKWKLSQRHSCCSSLERIWGFVSSDWIVLYCSVVRPFLRKQNGYTHIHVMESIITFEKLHTKAFLRRVYSGCAVNAWGLLSLETLSAWRIFWSSMCVCLCYRRCCG